MRGCAAHLFWSVRLACRTTGWEQGTGDERCSWIGRASEDDGEACSARGGAARCERQRVQQLCGWLCKAARVHASGGGGCKGCRRENSHQLLVSIDLGSRLASSAGPRSVRLAARPVSVCLGSTRWKSTRGGLARRSSARPAPPPRTPTLLVRDRAASLSRSGLLSCPRQTDVCVHRRLPSTPPRPFPSASPSRAR